MSNESILLMAQKYLDKHQPDGVPLEVIAKGLRNDGDWWYVPVRLTGEIAKPSHFFDELAEAEIEIKDKEKIEVLFVPAA